MAVVESELELFVYSRAEKKTGADFYLGVRENASETGNLEAIMRLEVSGVDEGTKVDVRRRLISKVRQARMGASLLPAIACVVGFNKSRLVSFTDVEGHARES